MKYRKPSRLSLAALLAVAAVTSGAWAGPNAGGTLVVHALEGVAFTSDNQGYCQPPPNAGGSWLQSCDEVVATLPDAGTPTVWVVYSVFSDNNFPALAGVEFGVSYSPGLTILDWGSCADFESAMPIWPASGTGTIVSWVTERPERIVETYWFAGYAYSVATGLTFAVAPHPLNGGHFSDRSPAPVLDDIADYGRLGFGTEGYVPCPETGTYLIRPDGTGDYPTIQDALSVAAPGSVIELADGIFSGAGNRDLHFDFTSLILRSASNDPRRCVIDCGGTPAEQHRGILVDPEDDRPSFISGITIQNGYAGRQIGVGFNRQGGAIRVNGGVLTVTNCIFANCGTDMNGGAVAGGAFPLELIDCVFLDNWADGDAAGALEIGGGADVRLSGCRFERNGLDRDGRSTQYGGAIRVVASSLQATDCFFSANESLRGGGLYTLLGDVQLERCTWAGNGALGGGAVYASESQLVLRDCTLSDNRARDGGGIFCDLFGVSLELSSTIIAFSTEGEAIYCGGAEISVEHSDLYGNADGDWIGCLTGLEGSDGNIGRNPLFCARDEQDYGLDRRSPCATLATVRHPGIIGAWPVSCDDSRGVFAAEEGNRDRSLEVLDPTLNGAVAAPLPLEISQITPNPASPTTVLEYTIPREGAVRLSVFDASGRQVRTLVDRASHLPGRHSVPWNGADDHGGPAPAGVYFARLSSGAESAVRRFSIIH